MYYLSVTLHYYHETFTVYAYSTHLNIITKAHWMTDQASEWYLFFQVVQVCSHTLSFPKTAMTIKSEKMSTFVQAKQSSWLWCLCNFDKKWQYVLSVFTCSPYCLYYILRALYQALMVWHVMEVSVKWDLNKLIRMDMKCWVIWLV